MIGLDGEKMSKSKGNLVFVSRLRGDGVDPMAIRLALLSGHYRTDRFWTADVLTPPQERLATWRRAVALDAGAPAAAVLRGLRERLADDLDTPGRSPLVDEWARRSLAGARRTPRTRRPRRLVARRRRRAARRGARDCG